VNPLKARPLLNLVMAGMAVRRTSPTGDGLDANERRGARACCGIAEARLQGKLGTVPSTGLW